MKTLAFVGSSLNYIKNFPEDIEAYIIAGNLNYQKGNSEQSRKIYNKALEIDPNNEIVRDNLRVINGELEKQKK